MFGALLPVPIGSALVAATAGAGAVTAAFYAAMQVALAGTLAGALASVWLIGGTKAGTAPRTA